MQKEKTNIAEYERNLEDVLTLLGREHEEALQLCGIIREGFRIKIPLQRIKDYADWYYESRLASHLENESRYIFPLFEEGDELIKKTLSRQRRLKRLFKDQEHIEKSLSIIEEELERLIRIHEKKMMKELKKCASLEQLLVIKKAYHNNGSGAKWPDVFWND